MNTDCVLIVIVGSGIVIVVVVVYLASPRYKVRQQQIGSRFIMWQKEQTLKKTKWNPYNVCPILYDIIQQYI